MSVQTNFYHTAVETAKTQANWISRKACEQASNAYATAGELAIKVRDFALPRLSAFAEALKNFFSGAGNSLRACAVSLKTHFEVMPKEAQAGVIASVLALAVLAGVTIKKYLAKSNVQVTVVDPNANANPDPSSATTSSSAAANSSI